MKMKKLLLLAMLAALTLGAGSRAFADSNPSNDSAALAVLITPSFERGVQIDTANVNLNLGLVDMDASTQTVNPATVTILGNILNTELDLSASITGGWVFDPNQTFSSTGTNQLNVWGTFTSISSATAPSQDDEYFRVGTSSGAKITSATSVFGPAAVGITGGSGKGRFENNQGGSADMDSMAPNDKRHFWIYMRTPPSTSIVTEQTIQFQFSVRQGP